MSRYIITKHANIEGVYLSKPGHWGNVWHHSVADAEYAAHCDAGTGRATIEREAIRAARR